MYNIIHIPTGRLVCYFDPKQLPKHILRGSQHRRPCQFFLAGLPSDRLEELTYIPDWVIKSILYPKRMRKRLLEGIERNDPQENLNRRSTKVYIEEFKFVKLE
jgi:hypothetical protein